MSDVVIRAENVWKRYQIGGMKTLWQHLRRSAQGSTEANDTFWALRDISFTIKQGESVGLLGHNGSGKSTLLKALCGVTDPTRGSVSLKGRTVPLIEVGAGFHPELSGRENIYLNASILGLTRRETAQRFDAIVAFAELETFIDTPVKRYSSGMFMRLAFAVASQIDPEILLIDEVLAVGDMGFQLKCMERIKELKKRGVTIVFVSHSMDAVSKVCDRAILLSRGDMLADGPSMDVINMFQKQMHSRLAERRAVAGSSDAASAVSPLEILDVKLLDGDGCQRTAFRMLAPMRIRVLYKAYKRVDQPVFGVAFTRSDGLFCTGPNTQLDYFDTGTVEGEGYFDMVIPQIPFAPDTYSVTVAMFENMGVGTYDGLENACSFIVEADRVQHGAFHIQHSWEHHNASINSTSINSVETADERTERDIALPEKLHPTGIASL